MGLVARRSAEIVAALLITLPAAYAGGTLTLTPTGAADGFSLTEFATVDPGGTLNTGPYGVGVLPNGNVMVNNYSNDTRYIWPDVDGQTAASALAAIHPSGALDTAFARAGGQLYGAVFPQFVQFNSDGSVNHVLTGVAQSPYFGMWGNPVNGHILATTGQGQLIDIDPTAHGGAGSATVIASPGLVYDGVTVSPDGSTVYDVENYHVIGRNIASKAQVYDSGLLDGGPDGLGVISSPNAALNGKLVVNFNGNPLVGFVALLDPATNTLTTIASGGTRGDYTAPDPTNGSIFLTYSDIVYRLSCGPKCAIGLTAPPPPAVTSVVSLSGYGDFNSIAPGTWIEIYGSNLGPTTPRQWGLADFNGNTAPTSLGGVDVSIGGQAAFVYYVNPGQVDAVVPSGVPIGGSVQVILTNGDGASQPFNINVNATQPGLLAPPQSFNIGGHQYVVAVHLTGGTYVLPAGAIPGVASSPAKPNETIVMFGIGFGPVTPDIPPGQLVTGQNQLATKLQILFGQAAAQFQYEGLAPTFVGLYQFNVVVPAVADSDLVPLTLNLGGVAGQQSLFTSVHQ